MKHTNIHLENKVLPFSLELVFYIPPSCVANSNCCYSTFACVNCMNPGVPWLVDSSNFTGCRTYLKGQGLTSRTVLFVTCLTGYRRRKMIMSDDTCGYIWFRVSNVRALNLLSSLARFGLMRLCSHYISKVFLLC